MFLHVYIYLKGRVMQRMGEIKKKKAFLYLLVQFPHGQERAMLNQEPGT